MAGMALVSLFLYTVCCVWTVSADGKRSLCSNTTIIEFEPEGEFVFPSTTANFKAKVCEMIISNPENEEVELTLVNVTKNCFGDGESYVEIRQEDKNIQSKYCMNGNVAEENITLKSTVIKIVYKASLRNGLEATKRNKVVVRYRKIKTRKLCRRALEGSAGTLRSPNYPHFSQGIDCEWTISTEQERTITLLFNTVDMDTSDCRKSFIELRDGSSQSAPLLVPICGLNRIPIRSKTSKLWVKMKSSNYGIRFEATYTTSPRCTIENLSTHTALGFRTPSDVLCKKWRVTAPSGKIAALSFNSMNLKSTSSHSCSGNLVEVWDGQNTNTYCNLNRPPTLITSKGGTLTVTYRSADYVTTNSFDVSLMSVELGSYNTKCFVQNRELNYKCGQRIIPCSFLCDGAIQCSDNSDEHSCPETEAKWQKLQVFVIIMGCICATTVIFCMGLVCFRKFVLQSGQLTDSHGRRCSVSDEAPLTPNADLPSPPPCYFNDNNGAPPSSSVIRGTYFFGNEFSQSGIHSASLFGIPPPRYRSTESLHRSIPNSQDGRSWQSGGITDIPLVATGISEEVPEDNPPAYYSITEEEKHDHKATSPVSDTVQQSDEIAQATNMDTGHASTGFTESNTEDNPAPDVSITNNSNLLVV